MAKIIYIASQRLPTEKAYGLQISKMCEAFADSGASVELLLPTRRNGDTQKIFEYYGVRHNFTATTIWSPDFYLAGKLDMVAFLIKQWISALRLVCVAISRGADVIYSRDEFPLFVASFYSRRPRIVFEAHKFSSGRIRFYKRFLKAGFKIVVISKGINDAFVKFGFKPENILIASDGVDFEEFNISLSRENCRDKLGLPKDKRIIGYVGQLRTMGMEKGIGSLIEALGILSGRYTDLVLAIVGGNDEDLEYYRSLAEKERLDKRILFLGRKEHKLIPFYLKSFDILAMPFPDKPHYALYMSPLKLFEYMASGRPIVSTDLPTIREVLNSENSVLVRPDDSNKFALGIESLLKDVLFSERLGKQALADVKNHTWKERARKIADFMLSS